MSALLVLGVTAGAVVLDACALMLAGGLVHDHVRFRKGVERAAALIHLALVAAAIAIGTSVRWQPIIVWFGVAMILWLLVTFYAPVALCATRRLNPLRTATGFAFATAAFALGMVAATTALVATEPYPELVSNPLNPIAAGLFGLGILALLLGVAFASIAGRATQPPVARPAAPSARPVGSARPAGDGPAHHSTPPAEPTPTRITVYSNAAAHNAMARTPCSACRGTGYDVQTYVFGSPHSWYLGRCPRCGHNRDFEFRTDD